ncbi:aminopeptidase [Rhodobacteraceae bacterium]|nr:aminopeptidase [Paracoccaceae bacterium]
MRQLLVIDTGGTIGMIPGEHGLVPGPGVVAHHLRNLIPADVDMQVVSFDPLLDSAHVTPAVWNRILDLIALHEGQPVLITHGTDTLAYTAAALAQTVAPDRAPVLLCAAMQPLGTGGDAEGSAAVAVARLLEGRTFGAGVVVGGALWPAAGLVKTDSHAMAAFSHVPQAPNGVTAPRARFSVAREVGVITITPGLSARALDAQIAAFDAAVLRIYGAGTFPDSTEICAVLRAAVARGMRLRAVSQCLQGGLEAGLYAAGAGFWATGVENGGCETVEMAFARLALSA